MRYWTQLVVWYDNYNWQLRVFGKPDPTNLSASNPNFCAIAATCFVTPPPPDNSNIVFVTFHFDKKVLLVACAYKTVMSECGKSKYISIFYRYHIYEVWIHTNANPYIIWQQLELGGCLFLKIFRRTRCRARRTFCSAPASFQRWRQSWQRSEISWPLPGVLEAVLVQALACQPPFWLFLIRKSLPAPG